MNQTGCSGFGIAQSRYMEKFDIIEVQHTFYQPPRIATLQKWRENAPDNFEFVVKAWQLITHESTSPTYRRLTHKLGPEELEQCGAFQLTEVVKYAWEQTVLCAQALRARRVLLQSPPSFTPTKTHIENLERFLSWTGKASGLMLYWEPRGAWDASQVEDLCDKFAIFHAVDPFVNETVTPANIYFRLHGGAGFRHKYSDEELRDLACKLGPANADPNPNPNADACVFFNNLSMIDDATRFGELMSTGRKKF